MRASSEFYIDLPLLGYVDEINKLKFTFHCNFHIQKLLTPYIQCVCIECIKLIYSCVIFFVLYFKLKKYVQKTSPLKTRGPLSDMVCLRPSGVWVIRLSGPINGREGNTEYRVFRLNIEPKTF